MLPPRLWSIVLGPGPSLLKAAPRRLTWQSLSGFENAGTATFEPLGEEACRVVVRMTYSVPVVLKPLLV